MSSATGRAFKEMHLACLKKVSWYRTMIIPSAFFTRA